METPSILFERLKYSKKTAYGANDMDLNKNPLYIVTDTEQNCNRFPINNLKFLKIRHIP